MGLVNLIALLIALVPVVAIIQMRSEDRVKKDAADFAKRETERKALKQAQNFDKF